MKKKHTIFYSLSGEGRGHASVAIALHYELMYRNPDIEILFFCGGKAYDFLKNYGLNVIKVPHFGYSYSKGDVRPFFTLLKNLKTLYLKKKGVFKKIKNLILKHCPDLIINDFEYFVPHIASHLRIPVINIHHQGILNKTKLYIPLRQWPNYLSAIFATYMIEVKACLNIIPSFFAPELKQTKGNNILTGPILRKEILEKGNIAAENFILVYAMDPSFAWIAEILKKFKSETFIFVGCSSIDKVYSNNIMFKQVDHSAFIKYLKSCKAVIATAGHTLISESLYLKKPFLAIIQGNQFEQYLNAYYLEKNGYGISCKKQKDLSRTISTFLKKIPSLKKNIQVNFSEGNKKAVDIIIDFLESSN